MGISGKRQNDVIKDKIDLLVFPNFMIFHYPQKIIVESPCDSHSQDRKEKICNENCVTFLGILLDSSPSWKHQIGELSKKLAGTIGMFHKISETSQLIPLETLKILYYSLFYSLVSHGITVWGLTHRTLILLL